MNTIVPDVMDENLKKRFKKRVGKTALCMLVASGAALATSSEATESALTLAPTDPATGQPDAIAPKPTGITPEGGSRLVLAGDANAFASQPNERKFFLEPTPLRERLWRESRHLRYLIGRQQLCHRTRLCATGVHVSPRGV